MPRLAPGDSLASGEAPRLGATRRDAAGSLRLGFPLPGWVDLLLRACDEIRFYGADSIQVMRSMGALPQELIVHVPPERRSALLGRLQRVDAGIRRAFDDDDDRMHALAEDRQGLVPSGKRRLQR